ncbi:MAG: serine--tRNA ligase [Gammaproteobacteria bacterium]
MLDLKLLRQNPELVAKKLLKRGFKLDLALLAEMEESRKALQIATEGLRNERNQRSKEIGMAKGKGEDTTALMKQVAGLGDTLAQHEAQLEALQIRLQDYLARLPNMPQDSVPEGKGEEDNVEIRRVGEPRKFDFTPKDHVDLGAALKMLDFERGAKIAGARFVVIEGALARLHRALGQFMLDLHTAEHGYVEVNVPYLVNSDSLFGTGQLPKLSEDMFHLEGEKDLWLIPTAEVPVTNFLRAEIVDGAKLPLRYVAYSACFRSEAGSYGKDTRGMIRQHQFEKVELVAFTKPEESDAELERLTGHAETILKKLGLPYRVVALCGGDLGNASAKTYDLEVWLPGQSKYREISSCSVFEAYHARRMQARYRDANGQVELLHTLNGSGLAIGRTLVAVMENYQTADGHIEIPECLRPYMGGIVKI